MDSLNLDLIPALFPPNGITSNFVDPEENSYVPHIASFTLFALATIALAARVFTKVSIVRKLVWEDYSLITGYIGFTLFVAFTLASSFQGGCRDQWNLNLTQMSRYLWYQNIITIVYTPSMLLVRLSVLLQFQRIFVATRKGRIYWSIMVVQVLNAAFYIATFFVALFPCIPREAFWDFFVAGKCIYTPSAIVATGAFNLFLDILMLTIPLYAVWQLQMASNRKWGVSAIFATGILGCIASLLRLYFSTKLFYTANAVRAYVPVAETALAEFVSIILVACGPVMPRLYCHIRERYNKARKAAQSSSRLPIVRSPLPAQSRLGCDKLGTDLSSQGSQNPSVALKSNWLTLSEPGEKETAADAVEYREKEVV